MDDHSQIKGDKTHKDTIDWLGFKMDPDYGIPRLCHCGEVLTEVVYQKHPHDTCPGKRYIVCTKYKENDGPHVRTPWVFGVAEELERGQRRLEAVEMETKELLKLKQEMAAMFYLPLLFTRMNGIIEDPRMFLLDKHGVNWSTKLQSRNRGQKIRLVGGWKDFFKANGVKTGESITLELIWKPDTSCVLKFCSKVKPKTK